MIGDIVSDIPTVMVGAWMVMFVVVVIMVRMTASNTVYIAPCPWNVFGQEYLLSPHLVSSECSFRMETWSPTPRWLLGKEGLGKAGRRRVTVQSCRGDSPWDKCGCHLLNIQPPFFPADKILALFSVAVCPTKYSCHRSCS